LLAPDRLVGTVLDGKYRLETVVGRGGMGVVYQARQMNLQRRVAVKVLPEHLAKRSSGLRRFRREALTVARLRHPNIVAVHDFGVSSDVGAFLVMEFLEGESLRSLMRESGRLTLGQVVDLMLPICSALQSAHAAGVVHRDLKPENVFIEHGPTGQVVKILDFGLAKLADRAKLGTSSWDSDPPLANLIGTPHYMSPEQCLEEEGDARSDVYALGCVMYEALSGCRPFSGSSRNEILVKKVSSSPRPISRLVNDLPPGVDDLLARAMARDPQCRFQTTEELANALERLRTPVSDARVAASRPGQAPPGLPRPHSAFIGRARDLEAVAHLLKSTRLVTLAGPGGIGKTRLALEIAQTIANSGTLETHLVDLSDVNDPASVGRAVAAALGVAERPGVPVVDVVCENVARRQILLLVDNCEHLLGGVAAVARALLAGCAGLRLLATSREPLGISGELVWRVPALSLPDANGHVDADSLLACESVRLFADRLRLAMPGFQVDDGNAPIVAGICCKLDGIPLALELAAARAAVLPLDELSSHLDEGLRVLATSMRDIAPRQQTLSATIGWSFALLTDDERTFLRRLAVFSGGFTLEAAEAVCSGNGIEELAVLDFLDRVAAKSLVNVDTSRSPARYWQLETIRRYSATRLCEYGEEASLRDRHLSYYLAVAEEAGRNPVSVHDRRLLDRLDAERRNFQAAVEWSQKRGQHELMMQLVVALAPYWRVRGHYAESHEWLQRGLARRDCLSPLTVARALSALAALELVFGNYDLEERLDAESLPLLESLGDRTGAGHALNRLGNNAYYHGNYRLALARYEASVALFRQEGKLWDLANSLSNLGMIARNLGDLVRAEQLHTEALELSRQIGDHVATARVLMNQGALRLEQGDDDGARALYEEALALFREVGVYQMEASVLNNLGDVARRRGDVEGAGMLYRQALEIHRRLGDRPNAVYSLNSFACLAAAAGQHERAVRLASAANQLREQFGLKLNPFEQSDLDEHLRQSRECLDTETAQRALAAGHAMDLETALDYATAGGEA
jgi:non-specific serine/threonine protein kinase